MAASVIVVCHQVTAPPYTVDVDSPSTATCGQLISVELAVHSHLHVSGRLRLSVAQSDSFLVDGVAGSVFEVRSYCFF